MRRVMNVLFPILLMASTATAHGLLWVSGDRGNTLMVGHPKDSELCVASHPTLRSAQDTESSGE